MASGGRPKSSGRTGRQPSRGIVRYFRMRAGRAGVRHGGEGRVDGGMGPDSEGHRIGRMALDRDVVLLMPERVSRGAVPSA